MNTAKLIRQVLPFLLIVVLLNGCGTGPNGQTSTSATQSPVTTNNVTSPTEVPTPITPTAVPTSVPTAVPTAVPEPTIQTPIGTLVIKEVEIASEDFMGNKPQPGYQILLVWLESPDGKVSGPDLFNARKGAYVTADDGSRTESYGGGLAAGRLVIGFTPPDKARNFKLYWPDNPPITLGK